MSRFASFALIVLLAGCATGSAGIPAIAWNASASESVRLADENACAVQGNLARTSARSPYLNPTGTAAGAIGAAIAAPMAKNAEQTRLGNSALASCLSARGHRLVLLTADEERQMKSTAPGAERDAYLRTIADKKIAGWRPAT